MLRGPIFTPDDLLLLIKAVSFGISLVLLGLCLWWMMLSLIRWRHQRASMAPPPDGLGPADYLDYITHDQVPARTRPLRRGARTY